MAQKKQNKIKKQPRPAEFLFGILFSPSVEHYENRIQIVLAFKVLLPILILFTIFGFSSAWINAGAIQEITARNLSTLSPSPGSKVWQSYQMWIPWREIITPVYWLIGLGFLAFLRWICGRIIRIKNRFSITFSLTAMSFIPFILLAFLQGFALNIYAPRELNLTFAKFLLVLYGISLLWEGISFVFSFSSIHKTTRLKAFWALLFSYLFGIFIIFSFGIVFGKLTAS
ncbi:YIP1 family protein [Leptospira santarosai]|uniref:Yip1 domain-containing protein n=1 Tax=Leptospira santarosai TaxID=28183 RepID=A0AB73NDA6_9LEPT|nr:YIP1 family protein [Leptospira santarosai]AVV49189.1 Uncharacterized protein XB17_00579 [Leptospira santarosai]ONF92268.1 hypothetical protein BWD14_13665 [Leptospira santarosai]